MIDLYELGKDIGRLILKFRKKKPMEEKYFEPVTARSLAEKIVDKAQQFSPWQTRSSQKTAIESIIEPHIRKPSDDDKSLPTRCEEAYYNAVDLMKKMYMEGMTSENKAKLLVLIGKSDPFKEADIVKEDDLLDEFKPKYIDSLNTEGINLDFITYQSDESKPTLLPFSLEEAKNGAKVVTRDGRPAKIICDDLHGFNPIMAIVTNDAGEKSALPYTIKGRFALMSDHPADLFILKESEVVDIHLFRHTDGTYYAQAPGQAFYQPEVAYQHIKTIKTTI